MQDEFSFDTDIKPTPPSDISLVALLPCDWRALLQDELQKDYIFELEQFLVQAYNTETVYPPLENVFAAFDTVPLDKVQVVLLGQDPYHGPGQAHGLSFSVPHGIKAPPSLRNMLKELADDIGCTPPTHGNLTSWAEQGVLLLNATLTVQHKKAGSHQKKGWEIFTDSVIEHLNRYHKRLVFILWGNYAKKKSKLITNTNHIVIQGVHPSPLSAHNGFFGSKPFSSINKAIESIEGSPIDWQL